MAAPTFRETGKPRPGRHANKTGAGAVISPPGAGNAIVIYDLVWIDPSDSENYTTLREQESSETDGTIIMYMHRGLAMTLSSPIQISENRGVYSNAGNLTMTYEIIPV